jgi:hypothetical protein
MSIACWKTKFWMAGLYWGIHFEYLTAILIPACRDDLFQWMKHTCMFCVHFNHNTEFHFFFFNHVCTFYNKKCVFIMYIFMIFMIIYLIFSIGNTLWLDPIVERQHLKQTETTINKMYVRSELLKNGFAVNNEQVIFRYFTILHWGTLCDSIPEVNH